MRETPAVEEQEEGVLPLLPRALVPLRLVRASAEPAQCVASVVVVQFGVVPELRARAQVFGLCSFCCETRSMSCTLSRLHSSLWHLLRPHSKTSQWQANVCLAATDGTLMSS